MAMSWLMIASLVFLLLPDKLHSQSDTTLFNFTVFDGKEADLIYQGDAHIATHSPFGAFIPVGERFIRLTSANSPNMTYVRPPIPLPESAGRVLYSPPIRLWDRAAGQQANFQTVIRGFIGNHWSINIGDGIAFFIAPVNTAIPTGSTGGNLGLYDSSGSSPVPLFAVELDVFVNSSDPSFRHVGINVNSRNSISIASWDAGGFQRDVEVTITYDARRLITVVANSRNIIDSSFEPIIARVDRAVDLKTLLPEWVQIGISASTGRGPAGFHDICALHDIRAWSFTSFMVPDGVTNDVVEDT